MAITIDGAGTITGLDADGISSQPVFPGNVLQVVSSLQLTAFSTSSSSFVTVLSRTITPAATSSRFLIIANTWLSVSGSGIHGAGTIARNGATLLGNVGSNFFTTAGGYSESPWSAAVLDSPNTTSEITYSIMARTFGSGTLNFGAGDRAVSLVVMEIAG